MDTKDIESSWGMINQLLASLKLKEKVKSKRDKIHSEGGEEVSELNKLHLS